MATVITACSCAGECNCRPPTVDAVLGILGEMAPDDADTVIAMWRIRERNRLIASMAMTHPDSKTRLVP